MLWLVYCALCFGCSNSHLYRASGAEAERIALSTCLSLRPDVMMKSHSCMTQTLLLLLLLYHTPGFVLFQSCPRSQCITDRLPPAHVPLLQGLNPSGFYLQLPCCGSGFICGLTLSERLYTLFSHWQIQKWSNAFFFASR